MGRDLQVVVEGGNISLSGVSANSLVVKGGTLVFQPSLFTNSNYTLFWKVGAACTTSNFEGRTSYSPIEIPLNAGGSTTVHFLLVDSTGTAANGGAADRIAYYVLRG